LKDLKKIDDNNENESDDEAATFNIFENGIEVLVFESFQGRYRVKSGFSEYLLSHLLGEESDASDEFQQAYLLTARSFISHEDLLISVFRFFHVSAPENATEEQKQYVDKFRRKVQLRVINFCLKWLTRSPFDFSNSQMKKGISDFVEHISKLGIKESENMIKSFKVELGKLKDTSRASNKIDLAPAPVENQEEQNQIVVTRELFSLDELITRVNEGAKRLRLSGQIFLHNNHLPLRNAMFFPILNFSAKEMASQLTLIDSEIFNSIEPEEFAFKLWGENSVQKSRQNQAKDICANLIKSVERFNVLCFWASSTICTEGVIESRVNTVAHWIEIAKQCKLLNNYSAVMAIIASLNSSAVQRLRKTWELLPDDSLVMLHQLEIMMSSESNYSTYRKISKRLLGRSSCVPYLGLYLKDMTFINDGNPKKNEKGHINFVKNWLIFDMIEELQLIKKVKYMIEKQDGLYELCLSIRPLDEQSIYSYSLQAEPRK